MKKLEHLIGARCEIKTLSNYLIENGYIKNITKDYIEIGTKNVRMQLEKANSKVKLIIRTSEPDPVILMGTVYISNEEFMRIVDIETISEFEKRKYFRVNVNLDTEAALLTELKDGERYLENMTPGIPIKIIDISLGGVLIDCEQKINVGDVLQISFSINEKTIQLKSEVRRIVKEGQHISCGCEFLDPSEKSLDLLYQYILHEQTEQIRNRSRI